MSGIDFSIVAFFPRRQIRGRGRVLEHAGRSWAPSSQETYRHWSSAVLPAAQLLGVFCCRPWISMVPFRIINSLCRAMLDFQELVATEQFDSTRLRLGGT